MKDELGTEIAGCMLINLSGELGVFCCGSSSGLHKIGCMKV